MNSFYSLLLLSLLSFSNAISQNFSNGSITTSKNQVYNGRISIDNASKKVLLKKNGSIQTYIFDAINTVVLNGQTYSIIIFENKSFFAQKIESGKASLYNLSNNEYLIIMENGFGKFLDMTKNKSQIPGTLSLLFNDCNSVRDKINKNSAFTESNLIDYTKSYNSCSYSEYSPTETEVSNASRSDFIKFYGGLQTGFNSTKINSNSSENTNSFGLGLGLVASPSFMGNLQGNLNIDFDASLLFTGNNDFNYTSSNLNYKIFTYRFSLGLEYLFNKNGKIKPFLGIGYGYSSDFYNGTIGPIDFKDNKQNYFFLPKIGLLYSLNNSNHIGITFSFISNYDNDLSFYFDDALYIINTENEYFNIGLNYYF